MYFVRGGAKISTRGGNISSPGDFVMGETLFRDTGTFSEEGGQEWNRRGIDNFFNLPSLLLSLPTLDLVFWVGKSASLPTQITKHKTRIV